MSLAILQGTGNGNCWNAIASVIGSSHTLSDTRRKRGCLIVAGGIDNGLASGPWPMPLVC